DRPRALAGKRPGNAPGGHFPLCRVGRQGTRPHDRAHGSGRERYERRDDGRYRSAGEGAVSMFDLTGMTALVTGASGGIGSSIARCLARQGARLALSGSNASKLRAFREELNEEFGNDHVEVTCDLSNKEQVEELVPATLDTLGKLDILVNNAGITRDNLVMRMKDE